MSIQLYKFLLCPQPQSLLSVVLWSRPNYMNVCSKVKRAQIINRKFIFEIALYNFTGSAHESIFLNTKINSILIPSEAYNDLRQPFLNKNPTN